MSWFVYFSCCLMLLVPQMSFTNGIPMDAENSQPHSENYCDYRIQYCACGASISEPITVAVKLCSGVDPITKQPTCEPCNEFSFQRICEKFQHCATCSLESCASCPRGKTGKFCAENIANNELVSNTTSELNFPIHIRLPRGDPNHHHRILRAKTGCDFRPMETSELSCVLYDSRVTCEQRCIWGYRLLDGARSRSYECTYRAKIWTPSSINDCERYLDCGISLVSNGKVTCTVNDPISPDQCLIACLTYDEDEGGDTPETLYICDNSGRYNPPLPYCARMNSTIGGKNVF